MKKLALTTTAVLLCLVQWAPAAECPTRKSDKCDGCCTTDASCKAPCDNKKKGIQYGEQAWLDIETVTVEAENGDPIAQYTVAYLTETAPEATEEHTQKAKEWYNKALPGLEKAAAEGHAGACMALAHMYATGKGVEKNPELAAKYKKMCKKICEKKCKDTKSCCPPAPANDAPAPAQAE